MKYFILGAVLFLTFAIYQGAGAGDGDDVLCSSYNLSTECCADNSTVCQWCNETQICTNSTEALPNVTCTDMCAEDLPTTAAPTTTTGPPTIDICLTFNESSCCSNVGCGLCQGNDTSIDATCQNVTVTACTGTDQCTGNETSTPAIITTGTSPTSTEKPTIGPPPCNGGQHFDAASFMGGIILCASLVAITFFGCKIYKGKTEQKYQQF